MIKQLSREVKMSRIDIKAYREQFGPRQLSQVERRVPMMKWRIWQIRKTD